MRISKLVVTAMLVSAVLTAEPVPAPAAPTVVGRILDATGSPIPGATITAGSLSTYSAESGEFSLVLKPGSYTVRIAADGFQDWTKSIELGGELVKLEVAMTVAPRLEALQVSDVANYQVLAGTSTKTATPLRDVPQSISVVPQTLMRDQGMQSMADVVRYIPGITMAQGEGHRDAPVIRGNATTSDFYVNGVRDDVQYYRDLYNVERVEAVKGANAITFGRGGGGGVINRVTKDAQFYPIREIYLQGGSFGNKRFSTDFSQSLSEKVAVRLNGVYENSDSYRDFVGLERYGVAPSLTYKPGERTQLRVGYEYFDDHRTVDRGIPSFNGIPSRADRSTFFGNPDQSYADARVNLGTVTVEHQFSNLNLRNTTLVGDYDKLYQNVFPGAVNSDSSLVSISGYNNGTLRRNLFNQTDVTGQITTGFVRHTLLAGTEFGRQRTYNLRQTAYFDGGSTSVLVPFRNPFYSSTAAFRPAASDAENEVINRVASVYVQDQVELNRFVQIVGGVRYDYFDLDFLNRRNNQELGRTDKMVSPRAALVVKPVGQLSLYSSYSVSYLPSAGDQFSSLTATSQTLKPEKFSNYEVGAKWDISRYFAFTAAAYKLDRQNTTARDPNNPAITVQTGSQRTSGFEAGINGNITRRWRTVGGYSYQDAKITSDTTAALRGALIPLVPRHTFSLWNNYTVTKRLAMGLGVIHQDAMFAGIDNAVQLPKFTRADLAAYYSLTENLRLQANVENLFDRTYFPTAHSNNNITPGSPRAARVGLTARF